MLEIYKESVKGQFEAALAMLAACVERCPDDHWHEPVVNRKFCQVAFHTLFFTDAYLSKRVAAMREQTFHRERPELFADYEELESREPVHVYEKEQIREYCEHCRTKIAEVIAAETIATLEVRPSFDWQTFSRAELHVYNIRHIHHHAAQLSLRLRLDTGDGIDWVRSGWPNS